MMEWILTKYWNSSQKGRPPKVGFTGPTGFISTVVYGQALRDMLVARPGSFEFVEANHPMGTAAFAVEIGKLKDCDLVILNALGPSNPGFIKEARSRGYQGAIVGTGISILGYWDLIKASVSAELLAAGDIYAIHTQGWWTDPGSLWASLEPILREIHPNDWQTYRLGGNWGAGWVTTLIFDDVVRRAVAAVGADKVDGAAIWDAVLKIDMTLPGYPESFKMRVGDTGWNVLNRMFIMRQFKAAQDDWFAITDWFLPPSLRD